MIDHLGPAGAQQQMVTLARGLKEREHTVELFLYYPEIDVSKERLREAGIAVHESPKATRFDLGPPKALRELIRSASFDVSISFLTTPNIYNVLAGLSQDTKTVVSERSAVPDSGLSATMRMRYNAYRLADHIVINSRHQHERLCSEFPWMTDMSTAIPNGVDLERFSPLPAGESGIDGDARADSAPLFLAVGSVHRGKNFLGLIEALKLYRERYDEIPTVDWAGREPSEQSDRDAYEDAQNRIERYGLSANWNWLGARQDVPELLRLHDAVIHPSHFEGLPNAVCEALAAGKPVLASNVCDHPWLVADGERGFLFDPNEPESIAKAMRDFALLSSDRRSSMASNSRSFAEQALSVDVLVSAYERLIGSLQ